MPRRPLSDSPMTNAERQARHRAARAAALPVIHYRRAADRRSRAQRWHEAVAVLLALQAEYRTWLQVLPESLHEGATAQALQAIDDLDLDELQAIEPPPDPHPGVAEGGKQAPPTRAAASLVSDARGPLLFATWTTPIRRCRGPFYTPIRGPFWAPIDREVRG